MSLHNIAKTRYDEWESLLRGFIHHTEQTHQLGLVEVAKAQLLRGMRLWGELSDPDVEDRERLMLLEDLGQRTSQALRMAMEHPGYRSVG